jgi:hypothetical protein
LTLTTFRDAIHSELEKDLGITFERGVVDGPNESYDVGCLWIAKGEKNSGNVLEWNDELHARVFKQFAVNAEQVVNPADLEAVVETIIAALKDIQVSAPVQAAGVWMFSPNSYEIDVETNGVEVVFTAWRQNPFLDGA